MKRFILILCLLGVCLRGSAQNQDSDMGFFINFEPVSNSTLDFELWGGSEYYQVKRPFFPSMPFYTNLLEIWIYSSVEPVSAWVLEKQPDGSSTPLIEMTNWFEHFIWFRENNPYFHVKHPLKLTTNEIHSLIAGNWYVLLNYGESSYLGHLAPQYAFANGPTATVVFPPPKHAGPNTVNGYKLITSNNRRAKFVLDGSRCTDPFYLPMEYLWQGWKGYNATGAPAFTKMGVMATNVFKVGFHTIQLQVSDPIASSLPFQFYVEVITAGQASRAIITTIQQTSLNTDEQQALSDVLSAAARHFDKNRMKRGCAKLELFQTLVEASLLEDNVKTYFSRTAQEIIDVFNKTQ
jgi:hypothetical protein